MPTVRRLVQDIIHMYAYVFIQDASGFKLQIVRSMVPQKVGRRRVGRYFRNDKLELSDELGG